MSIVADARPGRDWRSQGACLDEDPELFFPAGEKETGYVLEQIREAKIVCRGCDVVKQCRQWALATRQEHGVWGETSPGDRRRILRAEAKARAAAESAGVDQTGRSGAGVAA